MKNTAIIVFVSALVLCSMATPAMAQSTDTPWPTKYQNNNRTSLSPYSGPAEEPIIKWTLGGPGNVIQPAYSPVIGPDGTIYAAGFNTTDPLNLTRLFLAMNPDGTVKWNIDNDFDFRMAASIDSSGIIYVAGYKNLHAIYPNGTVKWSVAPGPDELNTPAIGKDGTIYVTAAAYYSGVYAYYPDGTEKWRIAPLGQYYLLSRHCPAIGPDGTIYGCGRTSIPGPDYHSVIRAIYPDGTEKWNFTILDPQLYSFVALAIGSDGTIYGAVNDRQLTNSTLYVINPDGTVNWSFKFKPLYAVSASSSLAIGPDGTIYLGTVKSDWSEGRFYAINPDGTEKWNKTELTDAITVDSTGTIYVGRVTLPSWHGVLSAITPDDGTEKWSHTLRNRIFTDADSGSRPSPAMDSDGTIYAITDDEKDYELYAFWSTPPEETFTKYLPEGWNLISLPLTPPDNSTASVFAGISHDAVYRYNATAETEQFENASTMEPGTGYFVNVTAPGQIWTYNGTPYTTMNVSLEQGLNTVGWLNCSKSISDALSSLGGKYNYVARFNATSQSFEAYNPHALSDDFNEFTIMSRGTGYFISMKEDSTLNESC